MTNATEQLVKRVLGRERVLMSDETLDTSRVVENGDSPTFGGLVEYLSEGLQAYEAGELEFAYKSDIKDENGEEAEAYLDPTLRMPVVNKKYQGKDAETLQYVMHELVHNYVPEEKDEWVIEEITGRALNVLSLYSELAEDAYGKWRIRQANLIRKYRKREGRDAYRSKRQEVYDRLRTRYATGTSGGDDSEADLFDLAAAPFKKLERAGWAIANEASGSWTGMKADKGDLPSVSGWLSSLGKSLYRSRSRRKAAEAERTKERRAAEDAREKEIVARQDRIETEVRSQRYKLVGELRAEERKVREDERRYTDFQQRQRDSYDDWVRKEAYKETGKQADRRLRREQEVYRLVQSYVKKGEPVPDDLLELAVDLGRQALDN